MDTESCLSFSSPTFVVCASQLPKVSCLGSNLHSALHSCLSIGKHWISMIRELKGLEGLHLVPGRWSAMRFRSSQVLPSLQVSRQIRLKCLGLVMKMTKKNAIESRIILCSRYPLGSNQEKAKVSRRTEKPWEAWAQTEACWQSLFLRCNSSVLDASKEGPVPCGGVSSQHLLCAKTKQKSFETLNSLPCLRSYSVCTKGSRYVM